MVCGSDRLSSSAVAWHQNLMFYGNCSCWNFCVCVCVTHVTVFCSFLCFKILIVLSTIQFTSDETVAEKSHLLFCRFLAKLSILLQHSVLLPLVCSAEVLFLWMVENLCVRWQANSRLRQMPTECQQQSGVSETDLAACCFVFLNLFWCKTYHNINA